MPYTRMIHYLVLIIGAIPREFEANIFLPQNKFFNDGNIKNLLV